MRVTRRHVGAQSHLLEQLSDAFRNILALPERAHAFGNDGANTQTWIERTERILKHHLGLRPKRLQRTTGKPSELDAAQFDAARGRLDQL